MATLTAGNTWTPAPGVTVLEGYGESGWGWNVVAVALPASGLALYSPSWLGDDTFARIDALGEPRVLLVPSHFHHLSLPKFRERYPKAMVVASPEATPRLQKNGHQNLRPLNDALPLLPKGSALFSPAGFKTGETWWSIPGPAGPVWIVCDAFMGVERELTGFTGFGLRRVIHIKPGLCVPGTLKWLHLKDTQAWVESTLTRVNDEKPATLVVTHGAPQSGKDLPDRMSALLKSL